MTSQLVRPRSRPRAPVLGRSEALSEHQRVVAWVLLRRYVEHRNGRPGLASAAVTRQELAVKARVSDRSLRNLVKALRRKGWPVCSSSATGGYWLTEDPRELREFVAVELEPRRADIDETAEAVMRTVAALEARLLEGAGALIQGELFGGGAR